MTLVSPPTGSNLTADGLALAEALVAAQLGLPGLERETGIAESGAVGSSGLIALSRPAVSIQSLTLAGAPAAGVLRSPWVLDVSSLVRPGVWGSVLYTVVYTSGWTAGDLPAGIRQAVLTLATLRAAVPVGIKSESMGPVSKTYAEVGALPADVLGLMRQWLPLRF